MSKIFLIPAMALALCLGVSAQNYVEASGQTNVFTLKAGAKAGWTGVLMVQRAVGRTLPITLTAARSNGAVSFNISGQKPPTGATLAVYAVNGELLERATQSLDGSFHLNRTFADGFYTVRLEKAGQTIVSTNFLAAR